MITISHKLEICCISWKIKTSFKYILVQFSNHQKIHRRLMKQKHCVNFYQIVSNMIILLNVFQQWMMDYNVFEIHFVTVFEPCGGVLSSLGAVLQAYDHITHYKFTQKKSKIINMILETFSCTSRLLYMWFKLSIGYIIGEIFCI